MMALLTDALRAMIGAKKHYPAQEELGRASIRYFALALGDMNPLYSNDDYARAHGYPSRIAPPTFVVESCQYGNTLPNENGYFAHEWDLPMEGLRTVRGGNEYEFFRPILPEDRISVTYVLEDIQEKTSRNGRGQLLVLSMAQFRDAADELVATNREITFLQPLGVAA
jgi:acyl dehydratase